MRVPTIIQFDNQLSSISKQSEDINTIQAQLSTGKKLNHSSDDPVLARNIRSTEDYIQRLTTYTNNTTLAQNRAKIVEGGIQGSLGVIERIKVLIHAAQTDTASSTDRDNIVKELQGLMNSLSGYANTKDAEGNYVFSGTSTDTTPFSKVNGVYQYMGSHEVTTIDVSTTVNLLYTDSGQRVFGDIRRGNGYFTIEQGSTPNTGTAETSVGLINSQTSYVEDTYTLSFVTNSNGDLAYQVVGASSGQVIPTPPATTPANAPAYQAGETISFNGISMTVNGQPNAGDSFVIAPSQNQNALESLNQLIGVVGMNISNDVDRADYHQKLSQLSAGFDQVSAHLTDYLSDVGYRATTIDSQVTANDELVKNQKIVLNALSDVDTTKAMPELSQHYLLLQLTTQSYVQLRDLFTEILRAGM